MSYITQAQLRTERDELDLARADLMVQETDAILEYLLAYAAGQDTPEPAEQTYYTD